MGEDREEQEAPKDAVMIDSTPEEHIPEDQNERVEPEIPVDPPKEVIVTKKRPALIKNNLQEAENMQLPVAPSERARDHASFPAMWR
jgi:hypothetical protein